MSIEIQQLYKAYQGKTVLNHIDLSIAEGSVFGLLGVNGAGKTTLVSLLNFLVPKDGGSIHILGKDTQRHAKAIKALSSFVPQGFAFYPNLTGYENLRFFGAICGLSGATLANKIDEVIDIVDLHKEVNVCARKYSGGYKRRLNLAIGLLNNPKVLYLDEPTVGVDAHTRGQLLKTIKNINANNGTTVLYTSHYMEEIEAICDDIAILDKGNIILHEKKDTLLKQHASLEGLFMQLTKEDFIR